MSLTEFDAGKTRVTAGGQISAPDALIDEGSAESKEGEEEASALAEVETCRGDVPDVNQGEEQPHTSYST